VKKWKDVELDVDFDIVDDKIVWPPEIWDEEDRIANEEFRAEMAEEKEKIIMSHVHPKDRKSGKIKKTKFRG
jgi:hypothetical protein